MDTLTLYKQKGHYNRSEIYGGDLSHSNEQFNFGEGCENTSREIGERFGDRFDERDIDDYGKRFGKGI